MKTKTNWWKWSIIAGAIISVFFIGRCNGIKSVVKINHIDTTIYKDSLIVRYKPIPYRVDSFVFVKGKPFIKHDSVLQTVEGLATQPLTDTGTILSRCNQVVYYSDSAAQWRIRDTLFQNRIVGREVKVICFDTSITKITTIYPPKKAILYLGFNAIGNPNNLLYGVGTDLSLKFSNDKIYGAGIKLLSGNQLYYEGKVMFPLRIKKK